MTLKEKSLRQQRKTLIEKAAAILATAKAEARDVSPTEVRSFEELHRQAKAIKCEIDQTVAEDDMKKPAPDRRTAGREDTDYNGSRSMYGSQRGRDPEKIAFRNWFAGGPGVLSVEERQILDAAEAAAPPEIRALTTTNGASGGYLVPQSFSDTLEVALRSYGGLLAACDFINTDNGQPLPYAPGEEANNGRILNGHPPPRPTTPGRRPSPETIMEKVLLTDDPQYRAMADNLASFKARRESLEAEVAKLAAVAATTVRGAGLVVGLPRPAEAASVPPGRLAEGRRTPKTIQQRRGVGKRKDCPADQARSRCQEPN